MTIAAILSLLRINVKGSSTEVDLLRRLRNLLLVFSFTILFSLFVGLQPAQLTSSGLSSSSWSYAYGGADYDNGYSIARCSAGGFITAGYTQSYSLA